MFEKIAERTRNGLRRFNQQPPRLRVMVILGTLALIGGAAWLLAHLTGTKERGPEGPVVIVAAATAKDMTVVEHAMATVVANTTVQVAAQVSGQLQSAAFQEGQIVKKGDLLFVIDPRPIEAALQAAVAQLAKDQAQLVNANVTKKRYDALFAQNAISSQQKDSADAAAKSAAATVAADQAQVANARINLGFTRIHAPVDGKTGPILIQPGNLVAPNNQTLVVLTQIEPVKLSFALPQSDLAQIQARQKAGKLDVLFSAPTPGAPKRSAKIEFVSNQVSNMTGTIELRATIDNADHTLVPGQQIDVNVTLDTLQKVTTIPREAVNDGPNGRYAFVVGKGDIAKMRPVTVLFDDGILMAVEGIKPKERVIIDGQLRVVPGAKVSFGKPRKGAKAR